jgi:serine/threonine protein kinase
VRQTRRLGRYHLTYRIAFGGMAELYRAFTFEDDGHKRDVAIKRLLPHFREDRSFVDMLTDEFKLVSYLRHPNIAEVYELVEVEEAILISMEYVDGRDLRSCVERARMLELSLPVDDVVYVIARSLEGLHHAHVARDARGEPLRIVHRDFSPSNVLVGYDGVVKLCDFGIAKASHNRIQTKTGIIKGKVKYMSPEQAFGRKLDWRSDVFSAGSVLYELCSGEAPFTAPNEIDLIFAVRDAQPRPVREVAPHLPEELCAIIEKSMARSRSARFQSALEFRNALLSFLRRHNPSYRRTRLASFMKKIFQDEIERELRAMEDFVLDVSVRGEDFGRNLIASALPKDAPFSRFSPNPTGSVQAAPNIASAPTQSVDTRGRKRPARVAADAPPPIDVNDPVHHEKTVIADRRLPPRPPGAPPPRPPPGTLPPPRSPLPKR